MRTTPRSNANPDIINLDDATFINLKASISYIKGTPQTKIKNNHDRRNFRASEWFPTKSDTQH